MSNYILFEIITPRDNRFDLCPRKMKILFKIPSQDRMLFFLKYLRSHTRFNQHLYYDVKYK